jgi:hypothetical protein
VLHTPHCGRFCGLRNMQFHPSDNQLNPRSSPDAVGLRTQDHGPGAGYVERQPRRRLLLSVSEAKPISVALQL